MSLHFDELFRKKLQKVPHFVKKHEKSSIWPKPCNFSNKLPCLCISMNFSEKSCKKCLISWKNTKNHRFGQNLQLFEQTTISWHFHELFRKKLQKVPHFVKMREKSSILPKLLTFRKKYHVFTFRWTLWQKVAKTATFREKARKLIDLAKTMQLFRTNYHVLGFRWTFQQKVAKSCSIHEKARKIIHLAKTFQLLEQTRKKLKKVPHFVKKHEKSSICISMKLSFHFDELFRKKLQKVLHFVKKHEKSSILPNLCNFSNKLPCLWISVNFSGKSCKKCLISWKSTRNHRFGQNFQLFEQTTMSSHFHELFSKKLQKVPHSVEKHEKSSIWPKLCNFFEQTTMSLYFDQLFGKTLQKVPHFVKQHEKSLIWPKLCNFWNKLQCLFPFDELSRKKLQKVRRLVKKHEKSSILSTCNFPRKLPCFEVSMNIAAKSCKKLLVPWKSTKNHQFGQLFATFRTKFDVFAFRWIFKEKVAKSASFREKARKIIDLANTLQLFEQTTMFWHFDEVFSKKLQKVPHFVKKHEKSSIWRKLASFPTNYHVLTL